MLEIILTKGIPASGKSTWAKEKVTTDHSFIRINNDDLREMVNNGIYSKSNEKLISALRQQMILNGLKHNKNIIIDNLNINSQHFKDVCAIVQILNIDVKVYEKIFYIDVEEAIKRDSTRIKPIGDKVIRMWFAKSGKEKLANEIPKMKIFNKDTHLTINKSIVQDKSLPKAVIFDNDGTISLLNGRNPYDASTADQDLPHEHVIECMKLYFKNGYKIIFLSGREEKYREATEKFYKKHFPEVTYELYMRPTGNSEKDVVIKERLFNEKIKNRYCIAGWFDDRLQVCQWVYENNLPLFRVNDPIANF